MAKLTARLAEREKIADATYAFQFDVGGKPFAYKSGQTVDVIQPEPRYNDEAGNRRTFSIADAPGKERLLVATRVRGSAFKRTLVEAPLGTALEIDGPYGSFTLPGKPSDVVLLAGGIGVTPFRSMIEDSRERSLDHTLTLIHSNRTPEEAPFLEELIRWGVESAKETSAGKKQRPPRDGSASTGKNGASRANGGSNAGGGNSGSTGASTLTTSGRPRFIYVPTMTQAARSARGWKGERRRVAPDLLDDLLPTDRNSPIYYVAGPERFVQGTVGALKTVGVDEDQIRFEEFPGY
ncbi:MAG TPA: FAD-dependent oxidoreductase [Candidatus Eisenbacteria bacterium]|nr:FAD-dependent oxidoreductase [Candidatus Eisenbacteria bacterium]